MAENTLREPLPLSGCRLALIKQGAEARIYSCDFFGKPAIAKERFPKTYRVPELDKKLTQRRMGQEVRSMAHCRKHGVRAPAVYHTDQERRLIIMERVTEGALLKDYIRSLAGAEDSDALSSIMNLMGTVIAQIHDIDLIHGDLTTSNMIYDGDRQQLTLIDFGLSFVSSLAEDKGVDLYVLERVFLSTHPNTERSFQRLLQSSRGHSEAGRGQAAWEEEDHGGIALQPVLHRNVCFQFCADFCISFFL